MNMKNVTECFVFLRQVQRLIFDSFQLNEDVIRLINENTCSKSVIVQVLIGFFNNYLELTEDRGKDNKYLLCLDNCEDMLEKS